MDFRILLYLGSVFAALALIYSYSRKRSSKHEPILSELQDVDSFEKDEDQGPAGLNPTRNQDQFRQQVISMFSKDFFHPTDVSSNKFVQRMELNTPEGETFYFNIVCRFACELDTFGQIELISVSLFETLKKHFAKESVDTFIVLGANGIPENPEYFFVFNLNGLSSNQVDFSTLEKHHKTTKKFFYNPLTKRLS